jgi:hypothetical protein
MTLYYDVVREELAEIAEELIAERSPSQPFGVYVSRFDEPGAELGRFVERSVFLEVFGNTRELLAREYDQYESGSVFITVVDHARRVPAGTMRVLVPSSAGFKSLNDAVAEWGLPLDQLLANVDDRWDLTRLWDLATLAVSAEYRGDAALGFVTQGLLQAMAKLGEACDVDRCVAILDVPVLRMLQWRLGRPFESFAGVDAREYLGSAASMPVWGSRHAWGQQLRLKDPVLYELFFEGRGFESVLSTPCWEGSATSVGRLTSVRSTTRFAPTPER